MSGYIPCDIIIIIIIRVSQTHIEGLWNIIQNFLHSKASRFMEDILPFEFE